MSRSEAGYHPDKSPLRRLARPPLPVATMALGPLITTLFAPAVSHSPKPTNTIVIFGDLLYSHLQQS